MISNFRHSKMHIPASEQRKIFQCSQCPFKTKVSGHLKRHCRIHDKIKPYQCPYCEYSSNNSVSIKQCIHISTVTRIHFIYIELETLIVNTFIATIWKCFFPKLFFVVLGKSSQTCTVNKKTSRKTYLRMQIV